MAIYHYHREIGKRHEGKNSVFAVAYIRGEERTCHQTEETRNFTYRGDVVFADCVLPDDAPDWAVAMRNSLVMGKNGQYAFDRNGTNFSDHAWNQIEIIERRMDAQLYFHDDFAIPIELDRESSIRLVRDFVRERLAVNGTFCDVAVHWDSVNPHAHVIMPMRQMTREGFSKKLRLTPWEMSRRLKQVRESWAMDANRMMRELGIDERVDHRSHHDRGIGLEPMVKEGVIARHAPIHPAAENQVIRHQNFERIRANPEILARKVARESGGFSESRLETELGRYVVGERVLERIRANESATRERLVNEVLDLLRHERSVVSERELKTLVMEKSDSAEAFNEIIRRVGESRELIDLGLGEDGRTHYVSREAFRMESELGRMTERLANDRRSGVSSGTVRRVAKSSGLNAGQREALGHLTQRGRLSMVVGVAGSGKTYLLKAARRAWEESGRRVRGIAFSGRAAAGLESEAGIRSQTIAGFLEGIRRGQTKIGADDILVMDEMGMTSLDDMYQVARVVSASGCKLVGVGDTEQTQPVGRGAPMRAMIEQIGCVRMERIIRQKIDWQARATLAMEKQRTADGLDAYRQHGKVEMTASVAEAKKRLVNGWLTRLEKHGMDRPHEHVMTAFRNRTVLELNQMARERLAASGWLEHGREIATRTGRLTVARGERVLFGRNDRAIGVKNGDFGTVTAIDGETIGVRLDRGKSLKFRHSDYRDLEHGYAATVHRLQGVTTGHVSHYIDSRGYDRHLFLVGCSRHRHSLTIVADHETFRDYEDLRQAVSRHGLKDHIFDYPAGFAIRRGFEREGIVRRAVAFVRNRRDQIRDGWQWLTNYQSCLESPSSPGTGDDSRKRREDAILVADFSDHLLEMRHEAMAINDLPGHTPRCVRQPPSDESIESARKVMFIYPDEDRLMVAAHDGSGRALRRELDTGRMDGTTARDILQKIREAEGDAPRLAPDERDAILTEAGRHGLTEIDAEERARRMRSIHQLKLRNSQIARSIHGDPERFRLAMERNQITTAMIEESIAFGERRDEVANAISAWRQRRPTDPTLADRIMRGLSRHYYGHLIDAMPDRSERGRFIGETRRQARQHRLKTACEQLDPGAEACIEAIARYLELNDELPKRRAVESHEARRERNALAHRILGDPHADATLRHMDLSKASIEAHERRHLARERVRRFVEMTPSTRHAPNTARQSLARRIKASPRLHGVAIHGHSGDVWKAINLEDWHFRQRHRLTETSHDFRASLKRAQRYKRTSHDTGMAWAAVRRRRQRKSPNTAGFIRRAEALSVQRDRLASQLVAEMERHSGAIGLEKIDLGKLTQRARQHDRFQRYLTAESPEKRTALARDLLDHIRECRHLIHHAGMDASSIEAETMTAAMNRTPKPDADRIRRALMERPKETYRAILGTPGQRNEREWRYGNGLVVTLSGQKSGMWHSSTMDRGGDPIMAIQERHGMSFEEAVSHGANIVEGMMADKMIARPSPVTGKGSVADEATQRQWRINSARSIWEGCEPVAGTTTERHFRERRGIGDLSRMEIRHWPKGSQWTRHDKSGRPRRLTSDTPAAAIPVRDSHGELTGVHLIHLDERTADPTEFMKQPRRSVGVIRDSAGLIQRGKRDDGRLYVTESVESAASLAMADPNATVLASLGAKNLSGLGDVIHSFQPRDMILATDNATTKKAAREALDRLTRSLESTVVRKFHLTRPPVPTGREKTDWNDLLARGGVESVQKHLGLTRGLLEASSLHYDDGLPVAYTPSERHLRETLGLTGADLSGVRHHPGVKTENGVRPAICIPAHNRYGERRAETLITLSDDGRLATGTLVRGDTSGCVTTLQRGNKTSMVFICDRLEDGLSIMHGDPEANVFMSLDHYRDLEQILWVIDTLPRKPGYIGLATDNFGPDTERKMFNASRPLRERNQPTLMVMGCLSTTDLKNDDYTHVSINEAIRLLLRPQEHVNYIIQKGINPPPRRNPFSVRRLMRSMRKRATPETVRRPEIPPSPGYIEFTRPERDLLKNHFAASDRLLMKDRYEDAIEIARTANAIYESMEARVRKIVHHPQRVNRPIPGSSGIDAIRSRIEKCQPISLVDAAVLFREVATIQLDRATCRELESLEKHIEKENHGREFRGRELRGLAGQFLRKHETLINEWSKNRMMPGDERLHYRHREKLPVDLMMSGRVSRETFLKYTGEMKDHFAARRLARQRSREKSLGRNGWSR